MKDITTLRRQQSCAGIQCFRTLTPFDFIFFGSALDGSIRLFRFSTLSAVHLSLRLYPTSVAHNPVYVSRETNHPFAFHDMRSHEYLAACLSASKSYVFRKQFSSTVAVGQGPRSNTALSKKLDYILQRYSSLHLLMYPNLRYPQYEFTYGRLPSVSLPLDLRRCLSFMANRFLYCESRNTIKENVCVCLLESLRKVFPLICCLDQLYEMKF